MNRGGSAPLTLVHTNAKGVTSVYRRNEELGHGGFATVYKVTEQKTKKEYALKVIAKEKLGKQLDKLQLEINIQASCHHPNIVRLFDAFQDSTNQYIVLELCSGGSMEDKYKKQGKLTELEVSQFLADAIEGIAYLHSKNIIHRDIKLGNFLMDSTGKVKIADFGLSFTVDDKTSGKTVCGTPNYLAPELLTQGAKGHSPKVDVWALGVCVFTLLNGYPPFESLRPAITYDRIKACNYRFNPSVNITYIARDFIQKVLCVDVEQRPSIGQLRLHPFVMKQTTATKGRLSAASSLLSIKSNHSNKSIPIGIRLIEPSDKSKDTHADENKNSEQENKASSILTKKADPPADKPRDKLKEKTDEKPKDKNTEDKQIPSIQRVIPDYCVSRFWDQSAKYGLGYLLYNGSVGVIFNDASKMIMDPHEIFIQYYSPVCGGKFELIPINSSLHIKKTSILKKFAKSLKSAAGMFELPVTRIDSNTQLIYIKDWVRDEYGLLFKYNTGDVQVNFEDKKKMFLYSDEKRVQIVDNIREEGQAYELESLKSDKLAEERRKLSLVKRLLNKL